MKGFAVINHSIKYTHSLGLVHYSITLLCGAGVIGNARVQVGHNEGSKVVTRLLPSCLSRSFLFICVASEINDFPLLTSISNRLHCSVRC